MIKNQHKKQEHYKTTCIILREQPEWTTPHLLKLFTTTHSDLNSDKVARQHDEHKHPDTTKRTSSTDDSLNNRNNSNELEPLWITEASPLPLPKKKNEQSQQPRVHKTIWNNIEQLETKWTNQHRETNPFFQLIDDVDNQNNLKQLNLKTAKNVWSPTITSNTTWKSRVK